MKITINKVRLVVILSTARLISALIFPNTMPKSFSQLNIINNKTSYQLHIQEYGWHILTPISLSKNQIKTDWRYASTNNFTGKKLYKNPIALLAGPAAAALEKACTLFNTKGLGVVIFDAYRPYSTTKAMWKIVPDERYAANPAKGSGHNRGLAIDLTLYDLKSGERLDMGTDFDHFSDTAHHSFKNLPLKVLENRAMLRTIMEEAGFKALETEWWHYSLPPATSQFPVIDLQFSSLLKIYQRRNK